MKFLLPLLAVILSTCSPVWAVTSVNSNLNKTQLDSRAAYIDAKEFSTLTLAKNHAVTNSKPLHISKNYAITVNTDLSTVPELDILAGGSFTVSSGVTLTLPDNFKAGKIKIFYGSGTTKFNGYCTTYPVWYGTPSSATLQAAIDALTSGTIDAREMGTWTASENITIKKPVTILLGAGTISTPNHGMALFNFTFDGSSSANYAELRGSNGTKIKMIQGCSSAIKNDECRWTKYSNIDIDMNNVTSAAAFWLYGGWYLDVRNITTGTSVVNPLSHDFNIDSHTNGVAGITGSWGGAYVNTFTNCQGRELWAVGHDSSTVTTTTFIGCDFQKINMTLCRQMTFLQPIIQPQITDTIAVNMVDTSSVSFIGGDFEFAGTCTMYQFTGGCRGIQSINNSVGNNGGGTITYIGQTAPGALSAGNYFMDDVWSTIPVNYIRGYWGSAQDLQFANSGYTNKHHIGTQYDGTVLAITNNATMSSSTTCALDDITRTGSALMLNGSGIRARSISSVPGLVGANISGYKTAATGATWTLTTTTAGDGAGHLTTIKNNSTNNHSGKTALITGTNSMGEPQTETITLPASSETKTGAKYFKTISTIVPSSSIGADTMELGWSAAYSPPVKPILDLTTGVSILSGTGNPEGVVYAGLGSLYLNATGGAGTSLYIKQTGSAWDNTGWVAK